MKVAVRLNAKTVLVVLGAGIVFQLLTSTNLPWGPTLDFSLAQIVFLLPIVYFFLKLKIGDVVVPKAVLILAVIGMSLGLTYGYTYALFENHPILLSKFQDDPLGARTRRFRKELNSQLRVEKVSTVGRFYRSFSTHASIHDVVGDNPEIEMVLWGNSGWIQLSINEAIFRRLHDRVAPIWPDFLPQYQLVNFAPATGLTLSPEPATVRFLVALTAGLEQSPSTAISLNPQRRAVRASYLRSAAGMESTWSSYGHRAFPLFFLANQHLREAFRQGRLDTGELSCALSSYSFAEKYLKSGDNPELQAAVFNNKAVALLTLSALKPKTRGNKVARMYLKEAVRLGSVPGRFGTVVSASQTAHRNLQLTHSSLAGVAGGKKGIKRKKKKRLRKLRKKQNRQAAKRNKKSKRERQKNL